MYVQAECSGHHAPDRGWQERGARKMAEVMAGLFWGRDMMRDNAKRNRRVVVGQNAECTPQMLRIFRNPIWIEMRSGIEGFGEDVGRRKTKGVGLKMG